MNKWFGFLLFPWIVHASSIPASRPLSIHVRIAEEVPRVLIRGFDLRIYETQRWGLKLVASSDKVSEWEFRCQEGKIRVRKLNAGINQPLTDLKEPVSIQTPVGFINYGNMPYRDELRIYSSGLLCDLVNDVNLEKYLDGLVNAEFSSKWNEESIAAQVVAARTYAYYQILEARKKKSNYFDLNATVKDQVYNGSMKEDYHSSRIVERTRGLILTAGPNSGSEDRPIPIKAFYHSTCGGVTELPENVWGNTSSGFKKSVSCPYCSSSPRYRWSLEAGTTELAQAIYRGAKKNGALAGWPKNALEILRQGKLMDIRVNQINLQRRVARLMTIWADGMEAKEFPIPGSKFREWIGPAKFRSTAFQVTFHKVNGLNSWRFDGTGNGHGVGLCQWGAKTMGEQGHKMGAILKYYYPDAILRKLW